MGVLGLSVARHVGPLAREEDIETFDFWRL